MVDQFSRTVYWSACCSGLFIAMKASNHNALNGSMATKMISWYIDRPLSMHDYYCLVDKRLDA